MQQEQELELDRLPGESARAHHALLDYAMMEPARRSIRALARLYQRIDDPPTRQVSRLFRWSRRWDWQTRVVAWDIAADRLRVARWEARRVELDEIEWQKGEELRSKAWSLLGAVVEARLSELVAAIEQASRMQRRATGQAVDIVKLEGAALDDAIRRELARLADGAEAGAAAKAEADATRAEGAAAGPD